MSITMTRAFDVAVFVGRFQPWHNGHLKVFSGAMEHTQNALILVGSANHSRTTRNPLNWFEREEIIQHSLDDAGFLGSTEIMPLDDAPYDLPKWLCNVQKAVAAAYPFAEKTAIIGHERDQSSFYLRRFPQWTFMPPKSDLLHINATTIRESFFTTNEDAFPDLPLASQVGLAAFRQTEHYEDLKFELEFEKNYRKQWGPGPHLTADNIVMQSGHILVVRRKNRPGRGLLAIPGGHLNLNETLGECAMREWWEEARFEGYSTHEEFATAMWPHFRGRDQFDDPLRSCRARVITQGHFYKLPDKPTLPKPIAGDDAAEAFWLPLNDVKPALFFEDHGFIIEKMSKFL